MSKKLKLIFKLLGLVLIITAVFFAGMRMGKTKKDAQQEVNKITYIKNANNEEVPLPKKFENEREKQGFYDSLGIKSKICFNLSYDQKFLPAEQILNLTANTKIYEVSFIVYSKEFAEKYGYPEKNVYPLDKGVQVMEFRVITLGVNFIDGYLNVLLDKDLGIDVPPVSYVKNNYMRFHFPDKLHYYHEPQDMLEARLKAQKEPGGWEWENYYSNNICLATMDYRTNKGHYKGAMRGAMLIEYSNNYFKGYDYFSIRIGCDMFARGILKQKNPSIWFKKIGGQDYGRKTWINEDDFIKFNIPQELVKKILPIMEETEMYNFSRVIEQYRRGKEQSGK